MQRTMARAILAVLLLGSTAAGLWAQSQTAALTGETHVSLLLIISIGGLSLTVAGFWITSARSTREWRESFVKLQQTVEDHHKLPHLTQADVAATATFAAGTYVSREVCNERHAEDQRFRKETRDSIRSILVSLESIKITLAKLAN
jgi:hypothetical protein